jgi:diguanylate cyclase (GGDEF)-like protein
MIYQLIKKENIKAGDKASIDLCLVTENVHRGYMLAAIIIIFETVCILGDVILSLLKVYARFEFDDYLLMYGLMVLINLAYMLLIKNYRGKPRKIKDDKGKLEAIIVIYLTLVMTWGSVVSLMDQRLYGQLMVFMVNTISCSVIYILSSKRLAIPYAVSLILLIVGLPFTQPSRDILIGHYVNLAAFIVLSWVASRIVYHYYYDYYISHKLLNETNKLLESKNNEIARVNKKLAIANDRLKELAQLDELTGIANRRCFREFIDREYRRCMNGADFDPPCTMSFIMFDIDYFKQYNDRYGHDEGDKVLVAVANELNSVIDESKEIAVRWGGEEFIYAAFNSNSDEVLKKAETIRNRVADLKIINEPSAKPTYITISAGVCTVDIREKKDVTDGIKLADKALYMAKNEGRNRIVVADADKNELCLSK